MGANWLSIETWKAAIYRLRKLAKSIRKTHLTSEAILGLEAPAEEIRPDWVVVVAHTDWTLAIQFTRCPTKIKRPYQKKSSEQQEKWARKRIKNVSNRFGWTPSTQNSTNNSLPAFKNKYSCGNVGTFHFFSYSLILIVFLGSSSESHIGQFARQRERTAMDQTSDFRRIGRHEDHWRFDGRKECLQATCWTSSRIGNAIRKTQTLEASSRRFREYVQVICDFSSSFRFVNSFYLEITEGSIATTVVLNEKWLLFYSSWRH